MAAGILTDEQFQQLSVRYSKEQKECEARIHQLEVELEEQEANIQSVDRYLEIQELTPEVLHEFVERIVVHERSERWKKKTISSRSISISTILVVSATWSKKCRGSTRRYSLCQEIRKHLYPMGGIGRGRLF